MFGKVDGADAPTGLALDQLDRVASEQGDALAVRRDRGQVRRKPVLDGARSLDRRVLLGHRAAIGGVEQVQPAPHVVVTDLDEGEVAGRCQVGPDDETTEHARVQVEGDEAVRSLVQDLTTDDRSGPTGGSAGIGGCSLGHDAAVGADLEELSLVEGHERARAGQPDHPGPPPERLALDSPGRSVSERHPTLWTDEVVADEVLGVSEASG